MSCEGCPSQGKCGKSSETCGIQSNPDNHIKNIITVMSGKGGVGKSTVTVMLAKAMAKKGLKVGIMDADITGPSIPRLLALTNQHAYGNEKQQLIPIESKEGIKVMSLNFLVQSESDPVIWRGPVIGGVVKQFYTDVVWGDLDVLLIDMPPGTGDAQLTLAQSVPVSAGINVTTPQHVALDDSRRSLDMFKKLHIPVAGIVENMSGFICPSCKTESDIFGMGTCEELATQYNTQVLANLPIEPAIREGGDSGKPIVYFNPESVSAKRYMIAADKLIQFLANIDDNIDNSAIQPIMPAGVSACSTEGQKIKAEHEEAQKAKSSGSCGTGCGCH